MIKATDIDIVCKDILKGEKIMMITDHIKVTIINSIIDSFQHFNRGTTHILTKIYAKQIST